MKTFDQNITYLIKIVFCSLYFSKALQGYQYFFDKENFYLCKISISLSKFDISAWTSSSSDIYIDMSRAPSLRSSSESRDFEGRG